MCWKPAFSRRCRASWTAWKANVSCQHEGRLIWRARGIRVGEAFTKVRKSLAQSTAAGSGVMARLVDRTVGATIGGL